MNTLTKLALGLMGQVKPRPVAAAAAVALPPPRERDGMGAGAMVQNAYLCCAANGLGTVVRAWFDHAALVAAMGLEADQQLLLCQTVGRIAAASKAG